MPGKDDSRGRWPLSRQVGAAAAVLVMLSSRGGSAQVVQSPPVDTTRVHERVTIEVVEVAGRFDVKVDPDVFVARRLVLGRDRTVDEAAAKLGEWSRTMETLIRREQEVQGRPAEVAKVREELANLRRNLLTIAGPGVEFVARSLPEGCSLEIDFRAQAGLKSPFLMEVSTSRPVRGRYLLKSGEPSVQSGRVDLEHFPKPSVWKYDVILRDRDGRDLVAIDPMGVLI